MSVRFRRCGPGVLLAVAPSVLGPPRRGRNKTRTVESGSADVLIAWKTSSACATLSNGGQRIAHWLAPGEGAAHPRQAG